MSAGWNASRETIDDLAMPSADDALSAILRKPDDSRFESRFTTWAYKFAILEAATRARRRARQAREAPVDTELSPHQREVLGALVLRQRLIGGLLGPVGPEVTCEECFDLLDVYVEYEIADMRADERVAGMREHLRGCPACAEEHDTLPALLTAPDPEHLGGGAR